MSDSTLRQDILDELDFEPSIDANDIGVAVESGVVTLTGYVTSYSQKVAIEAAVGRVKGVRGIAQEIEVRYHQGKGTSDDKVAKRVLERLKWSTIVPADNVTVKVQHGSVTLTGTVDWNYQRISAEDSIRDLKGVTGVINQIGIRPRVTAAGVKQHIEEALKRNAMIEADGIHVHVMGNKVILEGKVKLWKDRKTAEDAVWATPGVTVVEDHLTVS